MHNLHLMWMDSSFNTRLVDALNACFPQDVNRFVYRNKRTFPKDYKNCVLDPTLFSPEQINLQSENYDQIFLHSLYLKDPEILRLSDAAAAKIIWVVWGHDLYKALPTWKWKPRSICYLGYKWFQQRSIFTAWRRKRVARKIAKFRCIAIAYPYDEILIRKKYGDSVPVRYGPYFSKDNDIEAMEALRKLRLDNKHDVTNIMIGHNGGAFLQHEKYLRKCSRYRNENIHIYLVMSYLASRERIEKIRKLAGRLYRDDQYTIITKNMPQDEYFRFLTRMDVAIFAFRQQAALGNVKRLAYIGTKLYFHPDGVLAKGFHEGGVETCDVREVGRVPFASFIKNDTPANPNAPLFSAFHLENCYHAWACLLDGSLTGAALSENAALNEEFSRNNG